jgi:hypothetical protein
MFFKKSTLILKEVFSSKILMKNKLMKLLNMLYEIEQLFKHIRINNKGTGGWCQY